MSTITQPPDETAAHTGLLHLSGERELWHAHALAMWRDGWRACEIVHGDVYERGFAEGVLAYKRAQHDAHRLVELEMARWGGWREDFGRARPGDFPGRGEAT
jgi:hypothetical protein